MRTGESPATDDDQYLGYSVGSGDFTGDGVDDVALGVPKGLNYTGKVTWLVFFDMFIFLGTYLCEETT